jgi:flagellar basal body-associated protein FliL
MKKNIKLILMIAFTVIGLGLLIYCAVHISNYPGYHEMQKAARADVKVQQAIGLVLVIIAYVLTYVKKKF